MADTRLSNKKKKSPDFFSGEFRFSSLIRFVFFLSLSLLVVYIYYLHLIGNLQKVLIGIWANHHKVIIPLSIFIIYSTIIFQLGVWRGRRR